MTGRYPRCADFSILETRVRQRIEGWQVTGLSMMARLTIIRSVLSSLPMYLLSNSAIPVSCLRRIERCFRDFLWASMQDGHGIHLMSWETVCMPIQDGGLGIQSLEVRRKVLFAKHASRFILEPQCLWSSFMRARYGDLSSHDYIQPSRRQSPFWREVSRYRSLILEHTSWCIGDGSSVDIIQDSWISVIPLSRWPSFISCDIPGSMKVRDLISDDSSTWRDSTVTCIFGEELARRILTTPLIPGRASDVRVWHRSCLSMAPSKDLVKLFRNRSQSSREAAWIWKLPILPRIQLFLWKLLWEGLPTCAMLARRGVLMQSTCPLCGDEEETTAHAIFSCHRVRRIWRSVGYHCRFIIGSSDCFTFLDDLRKAPQHLCALWASTSYQIWLSRNQMIFTDECVSFSRIRWKIRALLADCALGTHQGGLIPSGLWGSPAASAANRHTVYISWEPPPPGSIKLNFDGSVRGRLAGSAYVIRGPGGNLMSAGGFGSLDSSVPMSELYAAWAGITYAIRTLHADHLIIEGDSMIVISWLRRAQGDPVPTLPLLQDIRDLLREVAVIQIRHIFREANTAADWVAGFVAYHAGFWHWSQGDRCPDVLQQIISSDCNGLTRTRMV